MVRFPTGPACEAWKYNHLFNNFKENFSTLREARVPGPGFRVQGIGKKKFFSLFPDALSLEPDACIY